MINRTQEEIISTWIGTIDNPIVTIRCLTYNHEAFIADALDSFLMQETTFPFEIIVHDDASTDNTRQIIESYYNKYPKIIKPLFEEQNQYSKNKKFLGDIIRNYAKGEYIAFCEGDDYWISKTKLQQQYEALIKHKNCYFCVHKTQIIGNVKNMNILPITNFDAGVIESDIFLNHMNIYNFHTSSFFFNKDKLLTYYSEDLKFIKVSMVGDIPLMLYFGCIGDVYYISDFMSVYRKNNKSSWTDKHLHDIDVYVKTAISMIQMMKEFNIYTNNKYETMCKKYINNWEFGIYFRTNDYKKIKDKRYAGEWKLLSFSRKIVVYIGCIFPKLADFIIKMHDKKRYKHIIISCL